MGAGFLVDGIRLPARTGSFDVDAAGITLAHKDLVCFSRNACADALGGDLVAVDVFGRPPGVLVGHARNGNCPVVSISRDDDRNTEHASVLEANGLGTVVGDDDRYADQACQEGFVHIDSLVVETNVARLELDDILVTSAQVVGPGELQLYFFPALERDTQHLARQDFGAALATLPNKEWFVVDTLHSQSGGALAGAGEAGTSVTGVLGATTRHDGQSHENQNQLVQTFDLHESSSFYTL